MSFALIERLGAGYFGEVWRATDLALNAERAVKLIPPEKLPDKANFFREAQVLKEAEHPNIVKVESAGTLQDGRVFVAMEYLPKGSVDDEAKGAFVPLTRAKRLMIDILRGLEWAHGKRIIHRDIKPANILVGNANEGKLSDFGLAIGPGRKLGVVAVKHYNYLIHLAPEAHTNRTYSVRSDIYACGVTLYRMVNGDSLLPPVLPMLAPSLASSGKYPDRTRYRAFVPRPLKVVINRAMAVRPQDRYPSAEGLRRALEQVTIQMNWSEQTLAEGTRWVGAWNDRCYEVSLVRAPAGTWSVIVRRGRSKHSLRCLRQMSQARLPKTKAERAARRVLQGFVLGVLK